MALIPIASGSQSAAKLIVTKLSSELISALQVVKLINADEVAIGSRNTYNNSLILGIALNAAPSIGLNVKVQTFGVLEDPFFNFPLNDLLFLGLNGTITNVEPVNGTRTMIGKSLGSGAIFISITEPVIL